MGKPKIAYYLAGGCGGCDISLVDLSEFLIDVVTAVDIVFFAPTLLDVKYKDFEALPDGSIEVGFWSGNVRNKEHEHMAKTMRRKCKTLIAYGICASLGGIKGLVNLYTNQELLEKAYRDTFSTDNPTGELPSPKVTVDGKYELELPELTEVRTLGQVVEVDYLIGGCPPHYEQVKKALIALLEGKLPPPGSWITMGHAVCEICKRNPVLKGKSKEITTEVKRIIEGELEEERCLLEAGYLCLGPVTQGDCGASCLKVNIPCRGCGGPIPEVSDFGLRAINMIASVLENEELVDKIEDPLHLFYRYSLPGSMLGGRIKK
ncbi:MAG: F420-nonreducing hydrogenase [Thermodesulfobacteriaceae bacterium]|nr:F420-nonreducing hydrogenase [Thermodesulfobacteriaceae bacterium]MCX8041883.1 F420-nonreducing hydrogenase [Thermodesulfobacteriaceae bacterium]